MAHFLHQLLHELYHLFAASSGKFLLVLSFGWLGGLGRTQLTSFANPSSYYFRLRHKLGFPDWGRPQKSPSLLMNLKYPAKRRHFSLFWLDFSVFFAFVKTVDVFSPTPNTASTSWSTDTLWNSWWHHHRKSPLWSCFWFALDQFLSEEPSHRQATAIGSSSQPCQTWWSLCFRSQPPT